MKETAVRMGMTHGNHTQDCAVGLELNVSA